MRVQRLNEGRYDLLNFFTGRCFVTPRPNGSRKPRPTDPPKGEGADPKSSLARRVDHVVDPAPQSAFPATLSSSGSRFNGASD